MNNPRNVGFTLIELVIFIVVISIGLVGILSVMNNTVSTSGNPMIRKQCLMLADSIMEEILQKAHHDPDGVQVVESSRDTYDDVDDFNGLSNAAFTNLPAELAGYVISIEVLPNTTNPAIILINGISVKQANVTVSRGNEAISLTGYRADF